MLRIQCNTFFVLFKLRLDTGSFDGGNKSKAMHVSKLGACQLYHATDVAMVLVTITLYCQVGMALPEER